MEIGLTRSAPKCPTCGNRARRTETRYGPRYACCDLVAWGNKPLTDEATRQARRAAHAAFDPIWQAGLLSRGRAYRSLALELGVPEPQAHMNNMPRELAEKVPEAARRIREDLELKTRTA